MTLRLLPTLLVLATTACASSGAKPESDLARPTERVIVSDAQGPIRSSDAANARATINVPPARALAVIKSVYEDLGIPSATVNAATGTISAPRFDKTRTLGKANLSQYFDCGNSLNGTIADTYRLYITIVSVVRSDGKGGSDLETALTGEAANMGGASSGRTACGSTGRLEQRIQTGVRERAMAGQ